MHVLIFPLSYYLLFFSTNVSCVMNIFAELKMYHWLLSVKAVNHYSHHILTLALLGVLGNIDQLIGQSKQNVLGFPFKESLLFPVGALMSNISLCKTSVCYFQFFNTFYCPQRFMLIYTTLLLAAIKVVGLCK